MQTKQSSVCLDRPLALFIVMLICAGSARAVKPKYDVLYPFQAGNDGTGPSGTLILDASGNLYGTTYLGGTGQCVSNGVVVGCGTVFELSPPPAKKRGFWTKTILFDFQGSDGNSPLGGLIWDAAGNLYGTTEFGGNGPCNDWQIPGCGLVFELSPSSGGGWKETILYNFQGGADGEHPVVGVVADSFGNLYGTTILSSRSGPGVVYELSPSGGSWTETVLYVSGYGKRAPNDLYASLILDQQGNLYTTSVYGGDHDAGTVFELSPSKNGGAWTETNLYSFHEVGGIGSTAPVVFDKKGNLYGTLFFGGAYGSVFQLSPPKTKGDVWTETVLYGFGGGTDGINPFAGVIFDQAGSLYGDTAYGGQPGGGAGYGTVFKLKPHGKGPWKETVLHRFQDHPAEYPGVNLVFGPQGELYGVTASGNSSAPGGVVFKISF
jgi:hypothetical protein